ncbi:hypothetical protein FHT28_005160 [Rhizobium sp. SG570]|nr:hypothetical protein [Rhizobium sp. SG570]
MGRQLQWKFLNITNDWDTSVITKLRSTSFGMKQLLERLSTSLQMVMTDL